MGSEQHSRKLNLYLRHRAELIDYATPIVGDRALAEDVVQDAWLRFSEAGSHDAKTRLIRQPVGYLYRIVRNLALDISRRQTAENLADETRLPEVPDLTVDAGRAMEGREHPKALPRAPPELPAPEPRAFQLPMSKGLPSPRHGLDPGL